LLLATMATLFVVPVLFSLAHAHENVKQPARGGRIEGAPAHAG